MSPTQALRHAVRAVHAQLSDQFHFTAEQHVVWIRALGRTVHWAVLPDWPCEDASPSEVRRRQVARTVTAVEVLVSLAAAWCCSPVVQQSIHSI